VLSDSVMQRQLSVWSESESMCFKEHFEIFKCTDLEGDVLVVIV